MTLPKHSANFLKIFSEFLVNFRQTVEDSYFNKYACFKDKRLDLNTGFEVQYAFSRSNKASDIPRINQSYFESVAGYTIRRKNYPF